MQLNFFLFIFSSRFSSSQQLVSFIFNQISKAKLVKDKLPSIPRRDNNRLNTIFSQFTIFQIEYFTDQAEFSIEARKKFPNNGKDTQKILSLETGGIAAKQFVTTFAFSSAFYLF